jgi:hypothetical protein
VGLVKTKDKIAVTVSLLVLTYCVGRWLGWL